MASRSSTGKLDLPISDGIGNGPSFAGNVEVLLEDTPITVSHFYLIQKIINKNLNNKINDDRKRYGQEACLTNGHCVPELGYW